MIAARWNCALHPPFGFKVSTVIRHALCTLVGGSAIPTGKAAARCWRRSRCCSRGFSWCWRYCWGFRWCCGRCCSWHGGWRDARCRACFPQRCGGVGRPACANISSVSNKGGIVQTLITNNASSAIRRTFLPSRCSLRVHADHHCRSCG